MFFYVDFAKLTKKPHEKSWGALMAKGISVQTDAKEISLQTDGLEILLQAEHADADAGGDALEISGEGTLIGDDTLSVGGGVEHVEPAVLIPEGKTLMAVVETIL